MDQPPLTPLLSRVMSAVVDDSLVGLRVLPALMAGATVLVASELGGRRSEQLLAAGGRRRRVLLGLAFVLSLPNLILMLPLLPERLLGPVVAVNYDVGGTVGWPLFAATVGDAYGSLPADSEPVVITRDYGEAGAIERFRPRIPVHSGHNGYWDWGPPPDSSRSAVFVGYPRERASAWCVDPVEFARIDNGVGLDNDEQDIPVWTCISLTGSWSELRPQLRRLG